MRYSGLILNDITAAPGLCVSFFTQGCPHKCKGCHNPETWSFERGKEFTPGTLKEIIEGLTAQGIQRDLCIMGGEPLCDENAFLTLLVIKEVKEKGIALLIGFILLFGIGTLLTVFMNMAGDGGSLECVEKFFE